MLAAAVLAAASALAATGADGDPAAHLDASLERAGEALLLSPELAQGKGTTGERALAALAALRSGVPAGDSDLSRSLARIFTEAEAAANEAYAGAYHAGLLLMLLEELGPRADDFGGGRLARGLAERLVEIQGADGGWGDVSRTEFACLGLRAAERFGERIPKKPWERAARYLVSGQLAGGGWGYREGESATGSMTAGACAALVAAGADVTDGPVRRGIAWLGERFRVDSNPGATPAARSGAVASPASGGTRHRFYFLGSLAAFARECGEWPEPAWALEGTRALLAEQLPTGGWGDDPQDRPTEFAVLFLAQARRTLLGAASVASVTVGVCSADGLGSLEDGGASVTRALGRWTDLRAEVAFLNVVPRRDGLRVADFAFVLALAGRIPFRSGDVAELARYVEAGGTVLVDGNATLPRQEALALARAIGAEKDRGEAGLRRVTLSAPAPLGSAEAPGFLSLGEGLLVAPEGVFGPACRERTPGARSAAERAAANAFVLAVSR